MQAKGRHHPALFFESLHTSTPHWIHSPPKELYENGELPCSFKFQHIHPILECVVKLADRNELYVEFKHPLRAVTPGQYAVFYIGDEMIGSAQIIRQGPSLFELEHEKCMEAFSKIDLAGPFGN